MKTLSILLTAAGLTFGGAAFLSAPKPAAAEDCTPRKIDVGGGKTVEGGCGPLRIAVAVASGNNVYQQANIKGAKDAAAKHGIEVEVFDGNWSPVTTFNQIQNVITHRKFNAVLTGSYEGSQYCKQLSEDAPAGNILVVLANNPACDRSTLEGEELWSPGTLTFMGTVQSRARFRDWLLGIADQNPGPQKVAILTGPEGIAHTINTELGIADLKKKHPEFEIVGIARTDYSVPQGNEKFAALLQANPDLTILISNYSDVTRGAVQAITQAGRSEGLKVYDFGGNKWAFEAVRRGQIVSTETVTPYTEFYNGVEALVAAWNGEKVPHYIPPSASKTITIDNVDDVKPEF